MDHSIKGEPFSGTGGWGHGASRNVPGDGLAGGGVVCAVVVGVSILVRPTMGERSSRAGGWASGCGHE